MSGSTGGEKRLSDLTVVSTTTGMRVLGFTATGSPRAIEPGAFAQAPADGVTLSSAAPLSDAATGNPGVATTASRSDHRHPYPTAAQVGAAQVTHSHIVADVAGLQSTLDSKANSNHTHSIAGVNGLQTALDAKANVAHSHSIGDIINLQPTLDAKLSVSMRGAANGVAPIGADLKIPLTYLPDTAAGVSNVNNGTVAGQVPTWNPLTSKYDPALPLADSAKKIKSVIRTGATAVSFAEYNNANIVLTANAPLTLAASEAGNAPNQGMAFMVKNRHTAINTITFGAGLVVDAYPAGTGSGGAVKIASKGAVTVHVYPGENNTVIAEVRGQIV